MFPFFQSIIFLLVVMLGGADRVLGPLIGALVVVPLPELLASLGQYRLLFVGVLILAVGRLAPTGLVGSSPSCCRRRSARDRNRTMRLRSIPGSGATGETMAVSDLAGSFGGVQAVRDLSFDARRVRHQSDRAERRGKEYGVERHLRFLSARCGEVKFGERIARKLRAYQIARVGLARSYQTRQLFEISR